MLPAMHRLFDSPTVHSLSPGSTPAEKIGQRSAVKVVAGTDMTKPVYLTKSVRIGIIMSVITAAMLIFLVFIAKQFFSILVLANILAFQLSFIWTCAEFLDGRSDEEMTENGSEGGDFSHWRAGVSKDGRTPKSENSHS
jgi:hypothetical protein